MDGCLFRGKLIVSAIFLALLLPGLAKADSVNAEWNSTTRALTTGNVGIASAEDPSTAAFYNPAALARTKKTVVEVFNPQVDMGLGIFTMSSSIMDWPKHASYSKLQPMLLGHPGTPSSAGLSLFPNLSAQNFSFGILVSGNSASYYDKNKNAYHYHSRKLLVPSLGMSAGMIGSRFKIGAAVRGVQINETNLTTPGAGTSGETPYEYARQGFGIALDSGMLLTMPWGGLPTLGLVARNIGGTAFPLAPILPLGGNTGTRHELIKMSFDAGLSVTPKFGQRDMLLFATDYRDILNSTKTNMLRKINIGLEYSAAKYFFFRTGFSQGYITAGIGLNSKAGAIDIGTYGEELDPSGFHGFLDRKFSIRLTRRF